MTYYALTSANPSTKGCLCVSCHFCTGRSIYATSGPKCGRPTNGVRCAYCAAAVVKELHG